MSAAVAHPPFDSETFLSRIDRATSRQEVLQLLRELEQHCADPETAICRSFSEKVATRLSHRFTQVR